MTYFLPSALASVSLCFWQVCPIFFIMSTAGGRGDAGTRPSNKDGGGRGSGSGRGSGGSSKKESILELAKVRRLIGC